MFIPGAEYNAEISFCCLPFSRPEGAEGTTLTAGQVGLDVHAVAESTRITLDRQLHAFRDDEVGFDAFGGVFGYFDFFCCCCVFWMFSAFSTFSTLSSSTCPGCRRFL